MIKFEVTGETWAEIKDKLKGLFPEELPITETELDTPKPEEVFKPVVPEVKIPEPPVIATISPVIEAPPGFSSAPHLEVIKKGDKLTIGKDSCIVDAVNPHLDSARKPHDPVIHTRTESKNEDGTWKLKRAIKSGPAHAVTTPIVPPGPVVSPISGIGKSAPITLEDFNAYAVKINNSGKSGATFLGISEYLKNIGIPNILMIPKEKLAETAELLKIQFGVEY